MRHLRSIAALSFLAVAAAAPLRAQAATDSALSVAYDSDTDSSTVTLVVPFSGHAPKGKVFGGKGKPEFTWTIGFVGAGKGPISASSITSVFAFQERMPAAYYNAHLKELGAMDHLELVIDGQTIAPMLLPPVIGSTATDERSGRVTLERTYAAVFAPEMLRRIADAAEVEGRLHGRGFVIDDVARHSLRELAAQLAPVSVADRAGR